MTDPAVTTGEVISADGTTIGYRMLGSGPRVALVHGAMSSGYHHLQLARLLADRFTVYLPDRRGRGRSGPYRPHDDLDTEVEDLAALLEHGDIDNVFGLSSGADICLEAALRLPRIRRVAAYEPAWFADPAEARTTLDRFERALADGDVSRALAIAMKGAQMGPAFLRAMPDALLSRLIAMAMKAEARKPSEYVPMSQLAPALRYDLRIVATVSGSARRFSAITAEVLLMGGSKSPRYLKEALTAIELALPAARRVEFAGLDHAAPWNEDRGGKPHPVAAELRRFFA
jgi:pimeloyl-ACP methyl ester carboxylesterase